MSSVHVHLAAALNTHTLSTLKSARKSVTASNGIDFLLAC